MLIIYTFIKFHQEYTSIDELSSSSSQFESNVTARRDGKTIHLNVKELVPGDIVLLSSGTGKFFFAVFFISLIHICENYISYIIPTPSPSPDSISQLSLPTYSGSKEMFSKLILPP